MPDAVFLNERGLSSTPSPAEPTQFLSQAQCAELFAAARAMMRGGGEMMFGVGSRWSGSAQWARNRIRVACDVRSTWISVGRRIRGAGGWASTTRTDPEGLRMVVREAEGLMQFSAEAFEQITDPNVDDPILHPVLWSDVTYAYGAEARTALVQRLIDPAESAGMLSAGTMTIDANGYALFSSEGTVRYYPTTSVQCSMTVRDLKGTTSGWAGVNHYALEKIDPVALAARALDKSLRMRNPSAIEPGRYTAILEPQATADLFAPIAQRAMLRSAAEMPSGPFGLEAGRSKINQRVLDPRLTFRADPMDPDGGFVPFTMDDGGAPYRPVDWVSDGILRDLSYDKRYALRALGLDTALPSPNAFRLTAKPGTPTATVDEMVERTSRGVLVTRFTGVQVVDMDSMLCSGFTCDGLWLIERGKISRPIKNFRFNESPLFVLNNLLDVGVSERVFAPDRAYVAPAVRVNDFSFTGIADGV